MAKIKSTFEGFLKDIVYTAYLTTALKLYEDKFSEAETIEVTLKEIPYPWLNQAIAEPIIISDDGKKVIINYTNSKYYDNKGNVTSIPDQLEVFNKLNFLMEKAVKEYTEKFKK